MNPPRGRNHRLGNRVLKLSGLGNRACRPRTAVTACEFLDPACGINKFLLTRKERMAGGANADFNALAGGPCFVGRATRAHDDAVNVSWMNVCLHI